LITGCSSGFGKGFALRLVQRGMMVFAGVRRVDDGERLRSEIPANLREKLIPVILDVTVPAQVQSAKDFILNRIGSSMKLFAVVNNAGIQCVSPVEVVAPALLRNVYDVNVFGPVNVVQAFAPLLREFASSTGRCSRLVMVGSGAGLYAPPFLAPYASTKHAVEALCDGLRVEMKPFGVDVCLLEPGSFASEIVKHFPTPDGKQHDTWLVYEKRFSQFLRIMQDTFLRLPQPTPVFAQLESLLFARFPPSRAVVGWDTLLLCPVAILMPDSVFDALFRCAEWVLGFRYPLSKKAD